MANLVNFGEQFASKVVRKAFAASVIDMFVNRDYEGEIKKPGDRVNLLSFLNAAELGDYSVGTDMTVGQIVDAEDQLVVEKRKYYNFSLDRLEDIFTYAGDIPDTLIELHSQKLASVMDQYVLAKVGEEAKAGNWIGVNFLVTGASATMASLTTTSTGGTINIAEDTTNVTATTTTVENSLDGNSYFGGFENSMLYKGIRMLSTRSIVSPWWRISGITSSSAVTVTEWDEATSGPDFAENYTLRGVFGGDGVTFPKYTDTAGNDISAWTASSGFGWEIQAAIATTVSSSTIYNQTTILSQYLDDNEIPAEGRVMVVPPWVMTTVKQASESHPTGVGDIFKETVINGKFGRVSNFDLVVAAGSRVSTRASLSTSSGVGKGVVLTTGSTGYIVPAAHNGFMTFAEKWTESRVVDAENQFAKKYQGLFLFGAKVPRIRRSRCAVLLASI